MWLSNNLFFLNCTQNKNLTFKLNNDTLRYMVGSCSFFFFLTIHTPLLPLLSFMKWQTEVLDTRKLAPGPAFQSLLCTKLNQLLCTSASLFWKQSIHCTLRGSQVPLRQRNVWQSSEQVSASGCCQRPAHRANRSGLKQTASAGSEKQALFLLWEKKLWVRHLSDVTVFPKACKAKS